MPNGSQYLSTLLLATAPRITTHAIGAFRLQPLQAAQLQTINEGDGAGSYAKATLSIADAFAGLGRGFTSWAVINLYYSVFYCAKAQLQLAGECHVYFNYSPYSISCNTGAAFVKGAGTSHDYAFTRFGARFGMMPSLSQEIDAMPPLRWLKDLRDEIQYRSTTFDDFSENGVMPKFEIASPLRYIREYLGRDGALYAFDVDHAPLAFPLYFFAETSHRLAAGTHKPMTAAQWKFFEKRCFIGRERIGPVIDLVRPLIS